MNKYSVLVRSTNKQLMILNGMPLTAIKSIPFNEDIAVFAGVFAAT